MLGTKVENAQIISMLTKDSELKLGVINDNEIIVFSDSNALIICTNSHKIALSDGVLWLGKNYNVKELDFVGEHNYILVNSENEKQIEYLAKIKDNVITLGLSAKDTISISSNDENSVVASLQRTIVISKTHVIEPMEISYNNVENYDLHCVLAFLGIKILLFG